MWNLLNVMQVLAYARNFTEWPATVKLVTKFIIEAIYLNEINNTIMDFGKSQFEVVKGVQKDEFMRQQGIEDTSLIKSLGVFFISICFIMLCFLLYYLIKKCARKCSCCGKARNFLQKKIFFNGPIRYVIVGYLKLMNQFGVLFSLGLAQQKNPFLLAVYAAFIFMLMAWPLWTEYFLFKNRDRLEDTAFRTKYNSLYAGIKSHSGSALCYNAVFAVRRLDLILMNIYFTAGSPLSGIDRTMYLQKIICFLFLQTVYLSYIHVTKPHTESVFNTLEIINEYGLVALAYIMLNYT